MDPILDAAVLEEKRLLDQRNEIDAKLAKLKDFLAMHAELSAKVGQTPSQVETVTRKRVILNEEKAQIATSSEVISYAQACLAGGNWMTTEAIHEGLTKSGYVIKAMHPVTRVSQILSGSHKFQAQRGKGWALISAQQKSETPNASNIGGLFLNRSGVASGS